MDKPQIVAACRQSVPYTVFSAKWIPGSSRIVVLGSRPKGTGVISVWRYHAGELELVKEHDKSHALRCGTFGASSKAPRTFATGDADGRICIYDVERWDTPTYMTRGHTKAIAAMAGVAGSNPACGAPELVTGSEDGCVHVWDPRQKGRPVASLVAEGDDAPQCWSVAFGNAFNADERCVAAGYASGDIKLYDLRMNTVTWETNVSNGVVSLQFDRPDIPMNKLVAATLEGHLHTFDMRTFNQAQGYAGLDTHFKDNFTVWDVAHMPQDRDVLMTGNGNGSMSLYHYKYPSQRWRETDAGKIGVVGEMEKLQNMAFSSQPIKSLDWSPDKRGALLWTSFDQTVSVGVVTRLKEVW
ncbi:WD domain, G-beta repeat [Carpediemonas membranifera]|uniref:WD domain, G-beta repeat n=1 Tax=Carpediemonas membranifera TaxID=201153 RepID=A0A8J6B5B4_9EUKA|nr:WD domain, G-beta repeat [Carpediemonas membranifera]|eukprot:KAG9390342.1 WD domain, G-beta repeat [Carpediemonas membranifera]